MYKVMKKKKTLRGMACLPLSVVVGERKELPICAGV